MSSAWNQKYGLRGSDSTPFIFPIGQRRMSQCIGAVDIASVGGVNGLVQNGRRHGCGGGRTGGSHAGRDLSTGSRTIVIVRAPPCRQASVERIIDVIRDVSAVAEPIPHL